MGRKKLYVIGYQHYLYFLCLQTKLKKVKREYFLQIVIILSLLNYLDVFIESISYLYAANNRAE